MSPAFSRIWEKTKLSSAVTWIVGKLTLYFKAVRICGKMHSSAIVIWGKLEIFLFLAMTKVKVNYLLPLLGYAEKSNLSPDNAR
jgi:hypothetical protein